MHRKKITDIFAEEEDAKTISKLFSVHLVLLEAIAKEDFGAISSIFSLAEALSEIHTWLV
jgi:hypothetical protein